MQDLIRNGNIKMTNNMPHNIELKVVWPNLFGLLRISIRYYNQSWILKVLIVPCLI